VCMLSQILYYKTQDVGKKYLIKVKEHMLNKGIETR
jgi:hypothetical protein